MHNLKRTRSIEDGERLGSLPNGANLRPVVIELSSDDSDDSPAPPKRVKSTLPLLQPKPTGHSTLNNNNQLENLSHAPGTAPGPTQNASRIPQEGAARLGSPLRKVSTKHTVASNHNGLAARKPSIPSNGFLHSPGYQSRIVSYLQKSPIPEPTKQSTGKSSPSTVKKERANANIPTLPTTLKKAVVHLPVNSKPPLMPRKAGAVAKPEPKPDRIPYQPQNAVRGATLTHRPNPASPSRSVLPSPQTSPRRSTEFTLEVPLALDKAPRHLREGFNPRKRKLLKELQNSVQPAIERIAEVEELFGQNGFSVNFSTDDRSQLRKAASRKLRHVDRSRVELDWGSPVTDVFAPLQRLFRDKSTSNSTLIHPAEQVREILSARFNDEQHTPPITFANNINSRQLSGQFQFVDDYIISPGVKISDQRLDVGCSCSGICRPSTCQCLTKKTSDGTSFQIETYSIPDNATMNNSYSCTPPIITLSEIFLTNELDPAATKFEIIECNKNCGCCSTSSASSSSTCWNRVVERGRTIPLEIFLTAKCGFGIRSSEHIKRGQFIELYLGEVITQEELERREDAKEEGASSYVFSLDFFNSYPGQECYHIDGEYFGTAMRFVNHSCNPNARSFTVVRGQNTDKRVHYVAFFAIRDIQPGEEICIDYRNDSQVNDNSTSGSDSDSDDTGHGSSAGSGPDTDTSNPSSSQKVKTKTKTKHHNQNKDPIVARLLDPRNMDMDNNSDRNYSHDRSGGLVKCQCGAANCRKWLWPPIVRKRKRKSRKFLNNDRQ